MEDFHAETELILRELKDAELNFEVQFASNEKDFKKLLRSFEPDVILSPYSLKGTNAIKILGIARKRNVEAPFILLAFDLSEDIAIDLLAEGVEDYILRSTLKRLPVAIRKALQRYKTSLKLKISEQRIRTSEESLRNMVRNAPIAVAMFDLQMNYMVVSQTWLQHEDKSEAEIIGKNHYQVVPEIPEHWKEIHRRCLLGEEHESKKELYVRKDGRKRVIRWKMNPWYTPDSTVGGAVLFIEDITEAVQTQRELEKTAESLAIAQKIAKIGSWEWDCESELVHWSAEMYRIYGIENQPITLEVVRSFIHPEDHERVRNIAKNDIESTIQPVIEYRILLKNGDVKHVVSSAQQVLDEKGRVIKLVGTLQDVTEKVLREEKEKAGRLQRELAINASEIGVWHFTITSDKVTSAWDDRSLEILGIRNGVLTSEGFFELLHPDDLKMVQQKVQDAFKNGEYMAEYRVLVNGEIRVIQAQGKTTFDEHGNPIRLDGILIDITDRKGKEEQLKTLSLVASETINGVLIHNPDGKIIWANKGFTRITGYTPKEVLGKEPWSIVAGEQTNKKLIELTYAAISKGKPFSSDNRLTKKNGDVVWVNTTYTPVTDDNGNVTKIVSIGTDITKQKELEGLQREMVLRLEKTNTELKNKAKR